MPLPSIPLLIRRLETGGETIRWHLEKGLDHFRGGARCVIPALEEFLQESTEDDLWKIAGEALQNIQTTDPGEW